MCDTCNTPPRVRGLGFVLRYTAPQRPCAGLLGIWRPHLGRKGEAEALEISGDVWRSLVFILFYIHVMYGTAWYGRVGYGMVWYVIDALSYSNYMRKKTLFESTLHAVPLCPPTLFQ